jgi:excisionase family DNA binding protein
MTSTTTSKVTASHLSRMAFLYVRQSTLRQVAENTESTRRQYALRERAARLGWPPERIEVIDCDLGLSGTGTSDRLGFQRLVAEVSMGHVGIVLGLEVSRLARNCSDWHRLLEICGITGALILDEDGLYDPTDFNDRLLLGIKGTMSEAELHLLHARLRGGLLAKASRGELKTALPIGLVYDERGRVVLHPDAQVQQSIRLLFDTFRRTTTACATVKSFREQGLLFPRPAGLSSHTAEVLWRPLTLSTVVSVLHNPRYAGAFAFGRRRTQRLPGGGHRTRKLAREDWHALVRDAHPGYIGWQDYEQNQERLSRSAIAFGLERRKAAPREGPALLQGLVLCGRCGSRMTVRYHDRGGALVPDYLCQLRSVQLRDKPCQIIAGASLDAAVAALLVETMTPVAIELTLAIQTELEARLAQTDLLRQQQVERAAYEADLARHRYMQVDPGNRLVASTLEADWNERLRTLDEVRQEAERQRARDRQVLGEHTRERIRALALDFPAVFRDLATTDRDRKRMAALLLEDVTLLAGDTLTAHVRFRGGQTRTLTLPRPLNAWRRRCTHPSVIGQIATLCQTRDDAEVAEILNVQGLRTGAGKPFDRLAIHWVRYSHGIAGRGDHLRAQGSLTVAEMSRRLGISEPTVRGWAREGRLKGHTEGRKPIWFIDPLDQQPPAIVERCDRQQTGAQRPRTARNDATSQELRDRIDTLLEDHDDAQVAQRLNDEEWRTATGRPFNGKAVRHIRLAHHLRCFWTRLRRRGKLSSAEMAVALGVGLSTIENWAHQGRLRGNLYGTRRNWLFEPMDEQPPEIRERASAHGRLPRTPGHASAATDAPGAV